MQPVEASDRWMLLFVGFLNHREELAQKLDIAMGRLAQMPDSRLVMAAWQKWGQKCLGHMYGIFSFAVCDISENQVHVIRSCEQGPGIFRYETADQVIYSTTTKAIFCHPEISKQVDEQRIADALILNYEDRERGYFKNIKHLPKGFILTTDVADTKLKSYFDLGAVKDVRYPRDADYVEHANSLLSNAVASTMRAEQTPGVSISSGLDSPTVAVAMMDHLAQSNQSEKFGVKGYCSVPASFWDGRAVSGKAGDESGPVRDLMDKYPELEVEFVDSADLPFDHGMDLLQSYTDMPMRGVGNLHWGMDLRQHARRDGRRVLLNGSSGNANYSFSGASVLFNQWFKQGRWLKLVREYNKFGKKNLKKNGWRFGGLFNRAILPSLPDPLFELYQKARDGGRQGGFSSFSAINSDYAQEMRVEQRMEELGWDDSYRAPPDRRRFMQDMMSRGGGDDGGFMLESLKMTHGVQGRDPLGDRKILEFCCAIPDNLFLNDGEDRWLIKAMMKDRLPKSILTAPRGDQAADWHGRMKQDLDRIDSELERLAEDPVMAARLDIDRMRQTVQNWPEKTPISAKEDGADYLFGRLAIGRALSIARFISQAEGSNK